MSLTPTKTKSIPVTASLQSLLHLSATLPPIETLDLPDELVHEIILQTSSFSRDLALKCCLINRPVSDLIRRGMMKKLYFESHEALASFARTLKMNPRLGEFVTEIGMIDVFKQIPGIEGARLTRVSTPDLDATLPMWKSMKRVERLSLLHPYTWNQPKKFEEHHLEFPELRELQVYETVADNSMNNFLQVSPYLERLLVLNPQMYPQPEGSLSLQVPTRLTHLCLMEPNLPGLHLPNLKSLIERSPDLEFVALVASPVRVVTHRRFAHSPQRCFQTVCEAIKDTLIQRERPIVIRLIDLYREKRTDLLSESFDNSRWAHIMMRDNCFWQILLTMTAKAEMIYDPNAPEEDQIAPVLIAGEGTGAYTAADWEATTRSQAEFHSAQLMQAAALTRANYLKMRADERKRNAQEIEIEEDLNYVNDAGGSRS